MTRIEILRNALVNDEVYLKGLFKHPSGKQVGVLVQRTTKRKIFIDIQDVPGMEYLSSGLNESAWNTYLRVKWLLEQNDVVSTYEIAGKDQSTLADLRTLEEKGYLVADRTTVGGVVVDETWLPTEKVPLNVRGVGYVQVCK